MKFMDQAINKALNGPAKVAEEKPRVAQATPAVSVAERPAEKPVEQSAAQQAPRDKETAQYFAYVAETTRRADAEGIKLADRAKAAKAVSPETAATYAKISERRHRAVATKGGHIMDGVSRASWHATRAALMHCIAVEAHEAKRLQEAAWKAGNKREAANQAVLRRQIVERAEVVMSAEQPEAKKKRQTKRETLPGDPAWREVVYRHATPEQRPGVAVVWATGCRPAELADGVDITIEDEDGTRVIHCDIPGKKVTLHSGQPHRRITILADSPQGRALVEILDQETTKTITRNAKVLNNDFARIRARMARKEGIHWDAAPYTMRHQMAADAKRYFRSFMGEDEAKEAVAKTLGHRVTRSQERYGHPRDATDSGSAIVSVSATHGIKKSRGEIEPQRAAAPLPRSDT